MTKKTIQIVGPYFTNYSLAKVNRGLALGINNLNTNYKSFLYCDKDKIDWLPTEDELSKSDLKDLVSLTPIETDVAIYNNFPKSINNSHNLDSLNAKLKLIYVAWEDNSYPQEWVNEINNNAHGVMAMTKFVRDTLIKSGVKLPIKVISNALDNSIKNKSIEAYKINSSKKFKFLHVSTAKYRKGVDLLIKGYFEEFTKDDDCVLVIKSFPGPDNLVEQTISKFKTENSPEIVHITSADLKEEEIAGLNIACDCAVYPTRGEGFGLPILEAMEFNLPVITTAYSGQLDFCNYDNSYLLDYKLIVSSENEIVNLNSYWAEPDIVQLKNYMREVFEAKNGNEDLFKTMNSKIENAKKTVSTISWENSAKQTIDFINEIEQYIELKSKNVAVLSFLNDQTGINFYSKELYKNIEASFKSFYYLANSDIADRTETDEKNVIRNWATGDSKFENLLTFLKEKNIDIFHIQYHPGEFSPEALNNLLEELKSLKIKIVITLHSVKAKDFDVINSCPNLKYAHKVIFHNKEDLDYARVTLDNCALMRIPRLEFSIRNKESIKKSLNLLNNYPIIATHGLLNVNKSVDKIIESIDLLKKDYPNILFISLSAVSPNNIFAGSLLEQLKEMVAKYNLTNNVLLVNEFLDRKVIEVLLQTVDINVLAYVDTAGESASAAVEKTLASYNPTIVTDIKAFEELDEEVLKIKEPSPELISSAITKLLQSNDLRESIVAKSKQYIQDNSYLNKALETLGFFL